MRRWAVRKLWGQATFLRLTVELALGWDLRFRLAWRWDTEDRTNDSDQHGVGTQRTGLTIQTSMALGHRGQV